jgi:hypothetical protein
MKQIFCMLLLSSAFALLGLSSAQAAPLCTGNSIQTLVNNGTCQDTNGLFFLTFSSTTGSNRLTPDSEIIVNLANSTSSLLDVQLLPTAAFNNDLAANPNSTAHYVFQYKVSFSPPLAMTNEVINIFNPFVSEAGTGAVSGLKRLNGQFEIDTPTNTGSANYVTLTNNATLPGLSSPVVVVDDITIMSHRASANIDKGVWGRHNSSGRKHDTLFHLDQPSR